MSSIRLRRLILLIFTGIVLGGLSLNTQVLSLVIPLLVYLAFSLINQPESLSLTVKRELTQVTVQEDAELCVKLTITNRGANLAEVSFDDHVPEGLIITGGTASVFTSINHNGVFEYDYRVSGKRGQYQFDALHITASDSFGLLRKDITIRENRRVSVLPTVKRINQIAIRPEATRDFAGPIPSRQAGAGTAFFGLREYQPGDPQRWINWRVSTRQDERLYSNQFEQERIADVGVIVDARSRNEIQINGHSLFEYSVSAAGSLAQAFLDDGNRVALLVYGRGLEWVTPGYGKHQYQRILNQLAKAKIGDSQAFDSLDYLPTQMFPAKSQIVLISPLSKVDIQTLVRMHARGYSVLVVSPNPVSLELSRHPELSSELAATRLAQVERAVLLLHIQRSGIRLIDWDIREPLNSVMRTASHSNRSKYL